MTQAKKKKVTSLLLIVALVAVIAVCATLAYLTSEDSDVNDMFNFTNLAMDLQLDEQLNAEELKELTGNFTANMNEITLNHNYKDFRDEMNDFSMSMDELQMHALDTDCESLV